MKEGVWGEQQKRSSGDGADPMGMWIGLAVFVLGIAMLLFLFYRGFTEFIQTGAVSNAPNAPDRFAPMLVLSIVGKWVLLFILAYIGSAIAGRGITLYQAARAPFIEEG